MKSAMGIPMSRLMRRKLARADETSMRASPFRFSQDASGNVWCFGEDTKGLDHGTVFSTEGSREAGVNMRLCPRHEGVARTL
jgi:hypothetical protein